MAEGWRLACVQLRGDWECLANVVGLPNWSHAGNMCWMRGASNSDVALKWQDAGSGAGWRGTRRTQESWKAEMGGKLPILFLLTIGLTISCVMVDTLHAVDLGAAPRVLGGVSVCAQTVILAGWQPREACGETQR